MSIGRAGGSRGAGALEPSGAGAGRTGSVHSSGGTDGPHRFARATGSGAGAPAEPDVASDLTIVRSRIDLGNGLGLQVVAEGVENEETWQRLARVGCDQAQGYHLSPPVPASGLMDWLRSSTSGGALAA